MTYRHDVQETEHPPARLLLRPRRYGGQQQRTAERTSTRRKVAVLTAPAADPILAALLDLSPTGLKLALAEAVPEGSEMTVEVMPGRNVCVTTRWTAQKTDHIAVGCQWHTPLTYDEVWKIRTYR